MRCAWWSNVACSSQRVRIPDWTISGRVPAVDLRVWHCLQVLLHKQPLGIVHPELHPLSWHSALCERAGSGLEPAGQVVPASWQRCRIAPNIFLKSFYEKRMDDLGLVVWNLLVSETRVELQRVATSAVRSESHGRSSGTGGERVCSVLVWPIVSAEPNLLRKRIARVRLRDGGNPRKSSALACCWGPSGWAANGGSGSTASGPDRLTCSLTARIRGARGQSSRSSHEVRIPLLRAKILMALRTAAPSMWRRDGLILCVRRGTTNTAE